MKSHWHCNYICVLR